MMKCLILLARVCKCLCVTQLHAESAKCVCAHCAGVCVCVGVSAVYMQWFYKTKLIMMLATVGNHNNRPSASARPPLISSTLLANTHNPDFMEADGNTKGYTHAHRHTHTYDRAAVGPTWTTGFAVCL